MRRKLWVDRMRGLKEFLNREILFFCANLAYPLGIKEDTVVCVRQGAKWTVQKRLRCHQHSTQSINQFLKAFYSTLLCFIFE